MTRREKMIILPLAAAALGAAAFCTSFQRVDGKLFPRNGKILDFTDTSLSAQRYEELQSRFPDKEILWLVPFQGERYPQDTRELTVEHLTAEEVGYLDYLPNLTRVDGSRCRDTDALRLLQQRRPECRVEYRVELDGLQISNEDTQLTYTKGDLKPLADALGMLPKLQSVTLAALPEKASLDALEKQYPNVDFQLNIPLGTGSYSRNTESLDLTGQTVDFAQLQTVMPFFGRLHSLNLTDVNFTEEEKRTLIQENPDVEILCSLKVCGQTYRTDETVLNLKEINYTLADLQDILANFSNLEKLVLGSTRISSNQLDTLNREYPDTDVVWNISIGGKTLSTDITFYYPAKQFGTNLPGDQELQKLRYCPKLVAVDIGHSPATECSWLEATPDVKYLIIADTPISDLTPVGTLKKLVYLEAFSTRIKDYSPLLGCTALQDINIGSTHGDPEPLSHMTWLHNLRWKHGLKDPETYDRVLALVDQLPDTNVYLPNDEVNIGGDWRYLPHYYVFRNFIGGFYLNQQLAAGYWGSEDKHKIMSTDNSSQPTAAAEVLTEIIQRRLENGEPIPCVKNRDSEKVQILLQSLKQER